MSEIPILPKRCKVCNDERRFAIQKAIDNKATMVSIAQEYDISVGAISTHINDNHRQVLLATGVIDYVVRKKAIDVGISLANYIEKWEETIEERSGKSIKDSDALKALELYSKIAGTLVNKHEVIVKRDIETALKEFLEFDDETIHNEEKTGKDDATKISKTAKS